MDYEIKKKISKWLLIVFRVAFFVGIGFVILYPQILKLAIALRSYDDIMDSSIIILPKNFSFEAFKNAMDMMNYNSAFLNSLIMSLLTGVLHVTACTLTAYSLAKFNFPLKKLFYIAVVITFFIPPQLLSVSTYSVFKNFDIFGLLRIILPKGINLLDNPVSLLFLYATANALKSGLFIYLMIQYFRNIPKELDEAAAVDGASLSRTFLSIVIPSSRVMLVTIFLFTFVWQWTDLQYTSMFFKEFEVLSSKLQWVGQTYALFLQGQGGLANPLLVSQMVSAGSVVFMLPLLVLYIICNKFFVQGIERSGIVG